jgi:hypothetical protein
MSQSLDTYTPTDSLLIPCAVHMGYYNIVRTHLTLSKDAPVQRRIHSAGRVEVRSPSRRAQYVRI